MMGKALKGRQSYVGGLHFDWSYIMDRYPTGEVVTMLREPVSRAVSHFNFMKKLSWTKGMAIRSETIDQVIILSFDRFEQIFSFLMIYRQ